MIKKAKNWRNPDESQVDSGPVLNFLTNQSHWVDRVAANQYLIRAFVFTGDLSLISSFLIFYFYVPFYSLFLYPSHSFFLSLCSLFTFLLYVFRTHTMRRANRNKQLPPFFIPPPSLSLSILTRLASYEPFRRLFPPREHPRYAILNGIFAEGFTRGNAIELCAAFERVSHAKINP